MPKAYQDACQGPGEPTLQMCPKVVCKAVPLAKSPRYYTMSPLFTKGAFSSCLPKHLLPFPECFSPPCGVLKVAKLFIKDLLHLPKIPYGFQNRSLLQQADFTPTSTPTKLLTEAPPPCCVSPGVGRRYGWETPTLRFLVFIKLAR